MGEAADPRQSGTVSPITRVRRRRPDAGKLLTIAAFLGPALLIYVWLVLLPVAQGAVFSLYDWNGLGPRDEFVGLENYLRLWNDTVFRGATVHNVIIAAAAVFVELPLAFALALLLRSSTPGRAFFRGLFFLPFVLSEVIAGLTWTFLFRPEGLVNGRHRRHRPRATNRSLAR